MINYVKESITSDAKSIIEKNSMTQKEKKELNKVMNGFPIWYIAIGFLGLLEHDSEVLDMSLADVLFGKNKDKFWDALKAEIDEYFEETDSEENDSNSDK